MKKINIAIAGAVAAAGIAMSAPASAEQYVSAQLGISEIGSYSAYVNSYSWGNGLSAIGTWGMTLPAVNKYFGIEAEVSKSIADPKADGYDWWTGFPTTAKYDYWTAGAYAVFTIPVAEKLSVRARGGVVYNNWKITGAGSCGSYFFAGNFYPISCNYSGSDINPSIGGGVVYNLNNNVNLMAEVTAFDINNGNFHLSAGAQFKF